MTPSWIAAVNGTARQVRAEFERQLDRGLVAQWPRFCRVRMLEVLLGGTHRKPGRSAYEGSIDG